MTDFQLREMDLSPLKRDELLEDFIVAYSRFIASGNFDTVKSTITDLAKRGQLQALAFYLRNVPPQNWEHNLSIMAREIDKNIYNGKKTPEEWEVVASLRLWDKVEVLNSDFGIYNVKELLDGVHVAYVKFNEIENEYHHRRYYDFYENKKYSKKGFETVFRTYANKLVWLYTCLQNQTLEFAEALKHAQLGYYGRYFKHRDVLDVASFVEVYRGNFTRFLDDDIAEKFSEGKFYGIYKLFKLMKKDYNENKAKNLIDKFALVQVAQFITKGDFEDCRRLEYYSRKGRKMVQNIANKPLSLQSKAGNHKINGIEKV